MTAASSSTTESTEMDLFNAKTIFITVLLIILTRIAAWIYQRRKLHDIFTRSGIRGPKPELICGNLKDIEKDFPGVMIKWRRKYGNLYGYFMGERPTIVIHDIELLKECFIKEWQVFIDRPPWYIHSEPFISSLIGLRGEKWKNIRSALTPSFSASKMKLLADVMNGSVDILLKELERHGGSAKTFNIVKCCKGLTLDVIAKCAFGLRLNKQENFDNPFFDKMQASIEGSTTGFLFDLIVGFPIVRVILSFIFKYSPAGKALQFLLDSLKYTVNNRRKDGSMKGIDILQLMVDTQSETRSAPNKVVMTDQEVLSNCCLVFLAGFETTASALSFACYVLSTKPDIQENVYNEIVHSFPDKEHLSYDDVHSLKYLDMFFSEVLRMYPPVPLFTTRDCPEDITVMGQFFPKGCVIQAPVWELHHDPKHWPEPENFIPERFSDENKSKIHTSTYMPFGIGPRICIGLRLAQLEAKLAIARMVKRFKFLPSEKTEDPIELTLKSVLLGAKNGVFVKLEKR